MLAPRTWAGVFHWHLLGRRVLGLLALESPVLVGENLRSHLLLLLTCFDENMASFQALTIRKPF